MTVQHSAVPRRQVHLKFGSSLPIFFVGTGVRQLAVVIRCLFRIIPAENTACDPVVGWVPFRGNVLMLAGLLSAKADPWIGESSIRNARLLRKHRSGSRLQEILRKIIHNFNIDRKNQPG